MNNLEPFTKHPKTYRDSHIRKLTKRQRLTAGCCSARSSLQLHLEYIISCGFRKLGILGHSLSLTSSVRDPLSLLIALVPVAHTQGIGHCGPRCVARAYLLSYVKRVGRPKALLAAAVAFPATSAVVFVASATAESGTHPVSEFQR